MGDEWWGSNDNVFCQTVIKSSRVHQSPSLISVFLTMQECSKFKIKEIVNDGNFSIIFLYYTSLYWNYIRNLDFIRAKEQQSVQRERFQGRATKKFNVKNIHFDKSKLEENKGIIRRNSATSMLNLDTRQISGLWSSPKHEILRRSREDLQKRWISRDVNPGKDCGDLISPRNFWQSAVFLRKKDSQNSRKPRTFRMKLWEWRMNPAVKKKKKNEGCFEANINQPFNDPFKSSYLVKLAISHF